MESSRDDLSMARFLGDTVRHRPLAIILPILLTFFGPAGGLLTRMTVAEYAKATAMGLVAGLVLLVLLLRPLRRQWRNQWQGRVTRKLDRTGVYAPKRDGGGGYAPEAPLPKVITIEGIGNVVVSDAQWTHVDVGALLVKDAGRYGWRIEEESPPDAE